jgi:integrase
MARAGSAPQICWNSRGLSRRSGDRLIFRLFVFCAFRPGELFALRWRSFLSYALRIEEAIYHGKLGRPKTKGSAGLVTLPQSLAEELKAWYEESGQPAADEFIFPSKRGTPLDAHNYLRRDVLRPAAEKVGIKGLTFQALRRTFATHFHRVDTVKDQQAQMRHSLQSKRPRSQASGVLCWGDRPRRMQF